MDKEFYKNIAPKKMIEFDDGKTVCVWEPKLRDAIIISQSYDIMNNKLNLDMTKMIERYTDANLDELPLGCFEPIFIAILDLSKIGKIKYKIRDNKEDDKQK